MRGRGVLRGVGLALVALMTSGWVKGQLQSDQPWIAPCLAGKEAACTRLGYDKTVAKEAIKLLKEREKGSAEIARKSYSERALGLVAWISPFPDVARAALAKLNAQALISDVALRSSNAPISREAFARLTDVAQLGRIVVNHPDQELRLAAVARLTDEQQLVGLLDPVRDSRVRSAILAKLTDQKRLTSLALTLADSAELQAVVARLSEPDALVEVALKSKLLSVANAAVARIGKQEALVQIIQSNWRDVRVRTAAFERLSDPELALKVALSADAVDFHTAAVGKISDDQLLLRVIAESPRPETRQAAFTRLGDRSGLFAIMGQLKDEPIISAAIAAATDRASLETLAGSTSNSTIRWAALSRMAQLAPSQPLPDAPPRTVKNSIGMTFVWIEPRRFRQVEDVSLEEGQERPSHTTILTRGYYLQTSEVTQAQWEAVMGTNPSQFKGPDRPVENVSWNDAQEFFKRLSQKEKGAPYRLPTEAEWECACRAGGLEPDVPRDAKSEGWSTETSGDQTHPIGQGKANAWGFFDLRGNVTEWVSDWYQHGAQAAEQRVDPQGPDQGTGRVLRGGNWEESAGGLRCSYRQSSSPERRSPGFGFRCALSW